MKRVALYVRVSTQEQAEEGYSIGAQTERLKAYCKARDWMVYDEYVDPGFSGSNTDRPALNKLIRDASSKKFDLILVYKLDRLSRSQKDTLYLIEDVFNANEVAFVSINENFDTSTAFGRAMIGILSVFAQLEREQIKERTAMGRTARAKDGLFHGGGYDPLGYDYIDGKLVINEYEAMQIKKVYELFLEGWTIQRIQRHMFEHYSNKYSSWNNRTRVRDVLRRESLTGVIVYGGEKYAGQHEAIIDMDTFQRVQNRYEVIKDKVGFNHHPFKTQYLLSGITECAHCGSRFYVKGNNYRGEGYVPLYVCYSRGKTNKKLIIDPDCRNKIHRVTTLDNRVIQEILKLKYDPYEIDQIIDRGSQTNDKQSELTTFEDQLIDIDRQSERILDLYQLGSMNKEKITLRLMELEKERIQVQNHISSISDSAPRIDKIQVLGILSNADEILYGNSNVKKRELLNSLIEKIVVDNDELTIHWTFE